MPDPSDTSPTYLPLPRTSSQNPVPRFKPLHRPGRESLTHERYWKQSLASDQSCRVPLVRTAGDVSAAAS
jgi:hypothetical protein